MSGLGAKANVARWLSRKSANTQRVYRTVLKGFMAFMGAFSLDVLFECGDEGLRVAAQDYLNTLGASKTYRAYASALRGFLRVSQRADHGHAACWREGQ